LQRVGSWIRRSWCFGPLPIPSLMNDVFVETEDCLMVCRSDLDKKTFRSLWIRWSSWSAGKSSL
jgi:hypothetical protein